MLILARQIGETVVLGDEVRVTVLGFKGNQVRLGISAPKSISVHREEVYTRIHKEDELIDGSIKFQFNSDSCDLKLTILKDKK